MTRLEHGRRTEIVQDRREWTNLFSELEGFLKKSGDRNHPVLTYYVGEPDNPYTPRLIIETIFFDSARRPETVSLCIIARAGRIVGFASGRANWNQGKPDVNKVQYFVIDQSLVQEREFPNALIFAANMLSKGLDLPTPKPPLAQ